MWQWRQFIGYSTSGTIITFYTGYSDISYQSDNIRNGNQKMLQQIQKNRKSYLDGKRDARKKGGKQKTKVTLRILANQNDGIVIF